MRASRIDETPFTLRSLIVNFTYFTAGGFVVQTATFAKKLLRFLHVLRASPTGTIIRPGKVTAYAIASVTGLGIQRRGLGVHSCRTRIIRRNSPSVMVEPSKSL